jgi:hypothetical protein
MNMRKHSLDSPEFSKNKKKKPIKREHIANPGGSGMYCCLSKKNYQSYSSLDAEQKDKNCIIF